MDTETAFDVNRHDRKKGTHPFETQQLVLATVSDGERHVVLQPNQLSSFISLHHRAEFAFFNVSFDYYVVEKELLKGSTGVSRNKEEPVELWRQIYQEGRFHDLMLLDQLLRLARNDPRGVFQRDLGSVSLDYGINWINKQDEHRAEYRQILGRELEWPNLARDWFDYAVRDTVAVAAIYPRMIEESKQAYERAGINSLLASDLVKQFGLLTERIQVGAAIALTGSEKRGFALDVDKVSTMELKLREQILDLVQWFHNNHPTIFHRYKIKAKAGSPMFKSATDLVPKMDQKQLEKVLLEVALREEITAPRTDKGNVRRALDVWREVAADDPFIGSWSRLADLTKLYQFVGKLNTDRLHPSYVTLVRTGRTSSREPNIQNMPKGPEFRGMFIAEKGKKLIIADYSAIELVTLAAVLEKKYGKSSLATVLRNGIDPHSYTAALVMGIDPVAGWNELAQNEPKVAKAKRQAAKAINFGVPGGLGAKKLAWYAKSTYGVDMSPDEAAELRAKLTTVVYPELGTYLEDTSFNDLARNLGLPLTTIWKVLSQSGMQETWLQRPVRKIIQGMPYNVEGEPYKASFVNKVWEVLDKLSKLSMRLGVEWKVAIRLRGGSQRLDERLFQARAVTLTGRIRSGVSYTEERNTKFQGLAADGAKLALWKLHSLGYPIVAFVHDEIVLEVEADRADDIAESVVKIMTESMSSALQNDLPVKVAYEVSDRWEKP